MGWFPSEDDPYDRMPLTAEYTWAESETTIQLQVPLKGQAKSKVDVFATECYLKVSFPPYLLEVDLDGCIDSTQPKARVEKGILVIKVKKKEGNFGVWGSLGRLVDRKCEPEVRARREESIKDHLKREEELKERVSLRKHQDERLSLRSQMNVEEAERRRIEEIKAEEKEKAEAEVYHAFAELAAKENEKRSPAPAAQPKQASGGEQRMTLPPSLASTSSKGQSSGSLGTILEDGSADEGSPVLAAPSSVPASATNATERPIWDETSSNNGDEGDDDERENDGDDKEEAKAGASDQQGLLQSDTEETKTGDEDNEAAVKYIPAPRVPVGVVPIGFTTRLFPTPLRESKVADESAWIMKNRRHLHKNKSLVGRLPSEQSTGEDDLAIDIAESDPVWLKGKGDDLYKGGDFLGAINAYTSALDADPKAAACYSNRAACHLRLGEAAACVADCGAALEILQTAPETGPHQARALARRSLAYRELGHYRSSLEDCRAALAFSPGNAALEGELARAEPLAKCETTKKEAVTRFASGDIAGACELYTAALLAVPAFPSCLSNRAACYLALGKLHECVRDCTAVLDILSTNPSGRPTVTTSTRREEHAAAAAKPVPTPPPGSVPPPGSDKRRQWVLTTVLRRARANVELGHLEIALRDYRAASSLAPDDKSIEGDVVELERLVNESRAPLAH